MTTTCNTIAPRRARLPLAKILRRIWARRPRMAQKPPFHLTPQLERDMGLIDHDQPRIQIEHQRDPTFRHPML